MRLVNSTKAIESTADAGVADAALVQRAMSGDDGAFETIMRRNNRALYRTARSILQDDAEAEDAVQEAYLRAYRSLAQFHGDARLTTWLTRIVINESLERLRKRKHETGNIALDNVVDLEMHMDQARGGTARP